jgi:hypothetical protein
MRRKWSDASGCPPPGLGWAIGVEWSPDVLSRVEEGILVGANGEDRNRSSATQSFDRSPAETAEFATTSTCERLGISSPDLAR